MEAALQAVSELFRNEAFWVFLGGAVASYYGYKTVKAKNTPKKITNQEELIAVVELLQSELVKKDKRFKDDVDYLLARARDMRQENEELRGKLAAALTSNARLNEKYDRLELAYGDLKSQLAKHEQRLNKDHVGENGGRPTS